MGQKLIVGSNPTRSANHPSNYLTLIHRFCVTVALVRVWCSCPVAIDALVSFSLHRSSAKLRIRTTSIPETDGLASTGRLRAACLPTVPHAKPQKSCNPTVPTEVVGCQLKRLKRDARALLRILGCIGFVATARHACLERYSLIIAGSDRRASEAIRYASASLKRKRAELSSTISIVRIRS